MRSLKQVGGILTEEEKKAEGALEETAVVNASEPEALTADTAESECNAVLETMDSCVGCVEGVSMQHDFEDRLSNTVLIDKIMPMPHQSLSEQEAALIRLQIMEKGTPQEQPSGTLSTLPDIDMINFCGNEEDMHDARLNSVVCGTRCDANVCETTENSGIVSQTDSLPVEAPPTDSTPPEQCAICFDEAVSNSNRIVFAKLPCCGKADETSSIKICTACILVLSNPTSDGASRVGRCPRCRSWIVVATPQTSDQTELDIKTVQAAGKCLVCNQVKDCLVEEESVCDACFLGRRQPLLYECQQCHVTQRIPHPMYRYQPAVDEFGNVSWACQGRCGTFTYWRIRLDQVALIPVGEAPWGDDHLEVARQRVKEARRELSQGKDSGSCWIL